MREHLRIELPTYFAFGTQECHSNRTASPWYTHVAPVSWVISKRINDGREMIVRTYSDPAKSGLDIISRPGLWTLIDDVLDR